MLMKRLKLFLLSTFALFPLALAADSPAMPFSYMTPSADGKYVLVMIAPVPLHRDGSGEGQEGREKAQRIRNTYKVSGLYLNDGSTNALWTVDWYAYRVFVPSDGIHLVRGGPWARSGSDEAFTFFEYGRPVRDVKINEVVDTTVLLHHTVSHFFWAKEMKLDDSSKTFIVATLLGEKYVFDYRTGQTLPSFRPLRIIFAVTLLAAVATLIVLRKVKRRSLPIAAAM